MRPSILGRILCLMLVACAALLGACAAGPSENATASSEASEHVSQEASASIAREATEEAAASVEPSAEPAEASAAATEESAVPDDSAASASDAPASDGAGNALVVYFSWSPEANTEAIAQQIAEAAGAETLKLEPATPYPSDYDQCTEVALKERDENARPEIANLPESLDEYDTILLGYPIWWHTAPMIIGTFLESCDLTGKQVYPFSQSASMDEEQFAESQQFVTESALGAEVHDGLFVRPDDSDVISAYLRNNGLAA